MWKEILSLVVLLMVATLLGQLNLAEGVSSKANYQENINRFTQRTVENYTNWLKDENLDPSKPDYTLVDLSSTRDGVDLDLKIWNHYVSGTSKRLELLSVGSDVDKARNNYDNELGMAFFFRDNITFGGNYLANGTITVGNSKTPITGFGNWRIGYDNIYQNFVIDRFPVTHFIEIPFGDVVHVTDVYVGGVVDFEFEGMAIVDGYEEKVKGMILDKFESHLRNADDGVYPIVDKSFRTYIFKVFKQVTYYDIIAGDDTKTWGSIY